MEALSFAELRVAARLYRSGVEGAESRLLDWARHRRDDLARALDVPVRSLGALDAHGAPAAMLAATIERANTTRQARKASADAESARLLALQLVAQAEHRSDGTIAFDTDLLREVMGLHRGGAVRFGDRGCVGAAKLRAILHETRHLHATSVVLTAGALVITYRTTGARGHIRLHLHPHAPGVDALHVPIADVVASASAVSDAPLDGPFESGVGHEAPLGPELPKPRLPPPRPFLYSLVTALHDVLRSAAS